MLLKRATNYFSNPHSNGCNENWFQHFVENQLAGKRTQHMHGCVVVTSLPRCFTVNKCTGVSGNSQDYCTHIEMSNRCHQRLLHLYPRVKKGHQCSCLAWQKSIYSYNFIPWSLAESIQYFCLNFSGWSYTCLEFVFDCNIKNTDILAEFSYRFLPARNQHLKQQPVWSKSSIYLQSIILVYSRVRLRYENCNVQCFVTAT